MSDLTPRHVDKSKLTMKALTNNVAEIGISYIPTQRERTIIKSSADAYHELQNWFPRETMALQERFIVCYLNRSNRVIGVFEASVGGVTGTVADPKLILGTALKVAASNLVLAHNHPSGSVKPSQQDIQLTEKIKLGAKYMDMGVLDHLILSPDGTYFSFADEGLI